MNPTVYRLHQKPKTPGEPGLPKTPVKSANIELSGLSGDHNNFRYNKKKNHPDMAIMILSMDVLNDLNAEGWPVCPGDLGENITLKDISYDSIEPTQQYHIGSTTVEITIICDPCSTLQVLPYVQKKRLKEFMSTLIKRRGWYAKVLKTGKIHRGDLVKKLN